MFKWGIPPLKEQEKNWVEFTVTWLLLTFFFAVRSKEENKNEEDLEQTRNYLKFCANAKFLRLFTRRHKIFRSFPIYTQFTLENSAHKKHIHKKKNCLNFSTSKITIEIHIIYHLELSVITSFLAKKTSYDNTKN